MHSYDAFHARFVGPGVKGIIGMHKFNICLVVVLSLSCSGVKTPLEIQVECCNQTEEQTDREPNRQVDTTDRHDRHNRHDRHDRTLGIQPVGISRRRLISGASITSRIVVQLRSLQSGLLWVVTVTARLKEIIRKDNIVFTYFVIAVLLFCFWVCCFLFG